MTTTLNTAMIETYKDNFLKEVQDNVEQGDWVKMCMQCGVCSGSCPLGNDWDHPPQKIFAMIRAGKREEVLTSDSMWMCTSCYNCIARCPRKVPVTHIMHGLASYASRLGLTPKGQPTKEFADIFWKSLSNKGRVNEVEVAYKLYFMDGFISGIKKALSMAGIGIKMLTTKRLMPLELIKPHKVDDVSGFRNMLAKAAELETARIHNNSKDN